MDFEVLKDGQNGMSGNSVLPSLIRRGRGGGVGGRGLIWPVGMCRGEHNLHVVTCLVGECFQRLVSNTDSKKTVVMKQ